MLPWMFDTSACLLTVSASCSPPPLTKLSRTSFRVGRNNSAPKDQYYHIVKMYHNDMHAVTVNFSARRRLKSLGLPYGSGPGLIVSITERGME